MERLQDSFWFRGGKAVMTAALQQPDRISKLISVDMPPVPLQLSQGFARYIEGMQKVDQAHCTKQSQADAILQAYESNPGIRMFLLTNLKRQQPDGILSFRLPLSTLANSLGNIGHFSASGVYGRPTLFIAGGKSPYYQPFLDQADAVKSFFPRSELKVVQGAGHWGKSRRKKNIILYSAPTHLTSSILFLVHAEKPDEVLRLITQFCQEETVE